MISITKKDDLSLISQLLPKFIDFRKKDTNKILKDYLELTYDHKCRFHTPYEKGICITCIQAIIKKYPRIRILNDNVKDILNRKDDETLKRILSNQKGQTKLNKEDLEYLAGFPSKLPSKFYIIDETGNLLISGEPETEITQHRQNLKKDPNREYLYFCKDNLNKVMVTSYTDQETGKNLISWGLQIGNKFIGLPIDINECKKAIAGLTKAKRRLLKNQHKKVKK